MRISLAERRSRMGTSSSGPQKLAPGFSFLRFLGDVVQHPAGTGFWDGEQVKQLDGTSEDELDPDAPSGVRR
nr:hypothetical protein CFP56_70020 [Quercus suber]